MWSSGSRGECGLLCRVPMTQNQRLYPELTLCLCPECSFQLAPHLARSLPFWKNSLCVLSSVRFSLIHHPSPDASSSCSTDIYDILFLLQCACVAAFYEVCTSLLDLNFPKAVSCPPYPSAHQGVGIRCKQTGPDE